MARFTRKKDLVEVVVEEVKWEREKSLIVIIGGEEVLIPRSQIGSTSEVQAEGDSGKLVIPRWLAADRGLL